MEKYKNKVRSIFVMGVLVSVTLLNSADSQIEEDIIQKVCISDEAALALAAFQQCKQEVISTQPTEEESSPLIDKPESLCMYCIHCCIHNFQFLLINMDRPIRSDEDECC
jgi:hypothetical protein